MTATPENNLNEEPDDRGAEPDDRGAEFVHLLIEHEPQVRVFLRGLLPTWSDVDDVVQEASLVAWRKFDEFEKGTAFGGWFLTIARFQALNHRRRIARTPLVFADDVWELLAIENPCEEQASGVDYRQTLENCMGKLKPEQRKLILRVHSPGVSIRDLAAETGKSEQAFYKAVQRLRAGIADCVSKAITAEGA